MENYEHTTNIASRYSLNKYNTDRWKMVNYFDDLVLNLMHKTIDSCKIAVYKLCNSKEIF